MENYIFDKPQKAFSIKAHDDDICLKVFRLQHIHAALFAASRLMADTYFKACTNGFNQLLTRFLAQSEGKVVVLRKEAQINVVVRHDVSPYLVKVRRTRKEIVAVII